MISIAWWGIGLIVIVTVICTVVVMGVVIGGTREQGEQEWKTRNRKDGDKK